MLPLSLEANDRASFSGRPPEWVYRATLCSARPDAAGYIGTQGAATRLAQNGRSRLVPSHVLWREVEFRAPNFNSTAAFPSVSQCIAREAYRAHRRYSTHAVSSGLRTPRAPWRRTWV